MTASVNLTASVTGGFVLPVIIFMLLLALAFAVYNNISYRKRVGKKLHKLMGRLAVKSDKTARAMLDNNEKFRKVILEMNEGLLITDAGHNIVFANDCACKILRLPEKRITGRKLSVFTPGASEASKIEELLTNRGSLRNVREELQLLRGDDEIIWAILSISYPADIKEISAGAIIVLTDITSHIMLERKMHKLTSYMVQKVRQQDCSFDIQQLVSDPGNDAVSVFKRALKIIPEGLRFGNDMRVEIEFLGKRYSSQGYKDTQCMYKVPLNVDGRRYGNISISYTGNVLRNTKPFRLGEKVLLKNIADKIANSPSVRELIQAVKNKKQSPAL